MNRALLIVYEPALFLLAALGWSVWELWSMRRRKVGPGKAPTVSPSVHLQRQTADTPEPGSPRAGDVAASGDGAPDHLGRNERL